MDLGAHCANAGVSVEALLGTTSLELPKNKYTCGLILELNRYSKRKQLSDNNFYEWIKKTSPPDSMVEQKLVLTAVKNLKDYRDVLRRGKKKSDIEILESKIFLAEQWCTNSCDLETVENIPGCKFSSANKTHNELHATNEKDSRKLNNHLQSEINKKKRHLSLIKGQINKSKMLEEKRKKKLGRFDPKNVKRREERLRKQTAELSFQLKQEREMAEIKKKSHENLEFDLEQSKCSLVKEQKMKSYYKLKAKSLKNRLSKLREGNKANEPDIINHIHDLENENQIMKEQLAERRVVTKHKGSFSDNIRQCVIELLGLEVASDKVSSVIKTVSKHIFNYNFVNQELPTGSTIRYIADEGQALAKQFIGKEMAECEGWGTNRDGTTRRKEKLLDTTVTLSSGKVYSLGFSKVAHETGEKIAEVTRDAISEVSDIYCEGNDAHIKSYTVDLLLKLRYFMSDRAANEKKSNQVLAEWRDDMLKTVKSSEEIEKVHSFYCSAHVLLGFHRNTVNAVSDILKETNNETLGRDKMSIFKNFRKECPVTRVVRMTSEIFGPAGDHQGVKDKWESYCQEKKIKSIIGNYRDNRFNGLFEVSAQIIFHRKEFVQLLDGIKTPNRKILSVLADLKCDMITHFVLVLCIFYITVTGPYWKIITSNVKYRHMWKFIESLKEFLNRISALDLNDPKRITEEIKSVFGMEFTITNYTLLFPVIEQNLSEISNSTIFQQAVRSVANSFAKTIEKQLIDFLPGGEYYKPVNMEKTDFAHVTNLACEHHFGDLDSSQRRRPNATLHYHSNIHIIKRNRENISRWLSNESKEFKREAWKRARSSGKILRKSHREQNRKVNQEIYEEILTDKQLKLDKAKCLLKKAKIQGKRSSSCCVKEPIRKKAKQSKCEASLPFNLGFKFQSSSLNTWVAVAYTHCWYLGVVKEVQSSEEAVVEFLKACSASRQYVWPTRPDSDFVSIRAVLKTNIDVIPIAKGRRLEINLETAKEIDNLFNQIN